jgi:hypothetical protein
MKFFAISLLFLLSVFATDNPKFQNELDDDISVVSYDDELDNSITAIENFKVADLDVSITSLTDDHPEDDEDLANQIVKDEVSIIDIESQDGLNQKTEHKDISVVDINTKKIVQEVEDVDMEEWSPLEMEDWPPLDMDSLRAQELFNDHSIITSGKEFVDFVSDEQLSNTSPQNIYNGQININPSEKVAQQQEQQQRSPTDKRLLFDSGSSQSLLAPNEEYPTLNNVS